jgi:hypothetical protein
MHHGHLIILMKYARAVFIKLLRAERQSPRNKASLIAKSGQ